MDKKTKKTRKPLSPKTKRIIVISFWCLFGGAILGFLILFLSVWNTAEIPDLAELESPKITYASQVFSADGKVLTTFFELKEENAEGNRSYVGYNELPQNLIDALVATEDARFYNHSGIDFQALARVGFKTLLLMDKG